MARSESPANGPIGERDVSGTEHGSAADVGDPLWRKLANAASVEEFCGTWLALQCRKVPGIAGGVVLLGSPQDGRPYAPVAFWPGKQQNLKHLAEVAQRALAERRSLVIKRPFDPGSESQPRYDIAYPVLVGGQIYGVVALDADSRSREALRDDMRQLQWGSAWMEVLFHRSRTARTSAALDRLQAVVSLVATVVPHQSSHGAATALVTELATRFGCDRVSIGFLERGHVQVKAVSHSADFGKNSNLVRAVGIAMDEAVDQLSPIVFPSSKNSAVVARGHAELARQSGNVAICSVPLQGQSKTIGAITFERAENQEFDREAIQLFQSVSALIGPVLDVQRRDDRWLLRKAADVAHTQLAAVIGPRHVARKLAVFGVLATVLFFAFAKGTYRVTARTLVEPARRQAVAAAYDGYISSAPVRAGDVVQKGQTLAQMDDRELKLERSKWESQQERIQRQYYDALGARKAAEAQVFVAQIAQAKAQVALLNEQIARTKIVAPSDGVIVTGDMSQSLGAPIERGQVLFELAPLDSYRIVLQVDERLIGDIAVGQRGRLALAGFVNEPLNFSIARITPVSTASEGRNFFRVEARPERVPDRLRPGMEGVGKIDIGRRRLIWIWTHELIDWLRLKIWNALP